MKDQNAKVCWFCEENPAEKKSALYMPLKKLSSRSYEAGQSVERIAISYIIIPRCKRCKSVHQMDKFVCVGLLILLWSVLLAPIGFGFLQMTFLDIDFVIPDWFYLVYYVVAVFVFFSLRRKIINWRKKNRPNNVKSLNAVYVRHPVVLEYYGWDPETVLRGFKLLKSGWNPIGGWYIWRWYGWWCAEIMDDYIYVEEKKQG